MAKKIRMYFSFYRTTYMFFASALLAQEPQTISGTLTDTNNDPVVQNTILLLKPDGTEHKRTETSKKRLGRGGGKFFLPRCTAVMRPFPLAEAVALSMNASAAGR